ncbi:MAG TPA: coagulation factor 5/8 type domain-containing protein, partial [Thermoanaerobaculia bacterium]
APRGSYPRAFSGEQAYWTVVGVDGDAEEGLLGEDGALEVGQGAFSIEPFLWMDGELVTWAGVEAAQSLAEGYLPIPTVAWTRGDLSLEVTAFAAGDPGSSTLQARYRIHNKGGAVKHLRLFLAIRPFQVNPPAQFLSTTGGVSPIRGISWNGRRAIVNGTRFIVPQTAPSAFGATTFDGGEIVEHLRQGKLPAASSVNDPFVYASAAFAWDLDLPSGGEKSLDLVVPLHQGSSVAPSDLDAVLRDWHRRLDRVDLRLPSSAEPLAGTFKTAIGHILINRDGPALQPGSRSYARTWIRDGALESLALLRAGHAKEVRDFIEWFAPYQFASGKVPCCVDKRGADPVPENDSHGEWLFLVAEYWRYSRDWATVEKVWPHVEKAVAYIDELRRQRRTDEYRQADKRKFFGLLPESISHEGYSAHPVHSYWDDFFALTGLKDAADLAQALGKTEETARWAASRDEFRADLYASLNRVISEAGIDYIPGSADLADFDATSTTIAISPGGELANLPQPALEHTFERYWKEFVHRRSATDWEAYTPYELRAVGTFIRLGWKTRAHELLDFFMKDRRPPAWNQWPEVVRRDPRAPGFQGDLPHTWVGSDFVRSFLDLFAYEDRNALVLGAGIPETWLAQPEGIAVLGLGTPWGKLTYSLKRQGGGVRYTIAEGIEIPPGGIVLSWPLAGEAKGGPVVVREVPATVDLVPGYSSVNPKPERFALRSPHSPGPSLPEGERGKKAEILRFFFIPSSPFGRGGVGEVRASEPARSVFLSGVGTP